MRFDIFIGGKVSVLSLFLYMNGYIRKFACMEKRSGGTYEKCYWV